MAITLSFDKFSNHPIDPGDIQQNNESVFQLRSPSGEYLTDLNFARITQSVTLKGVPAALADTIEGYLSDYATSVVTGALPTANVTLDGKSYAVKTVEKGSSITVNGNKVYPSLSMTVISNDLTIV
jgi:hypothetical protein